MAVAAAVLTVLAIAAVLLSRDRGHEGPPAQPRPRVGGRILVGAEQLPSCLNPIQSCAASPWLAYLVTSQVLPKAMTLDADGNFVASPLLVAAPTIDNGGIKQDPFTITYIIDPKAVWDDGTAITSADFEFSWHAWLDTTGSSRTRGYDRIARIETSDPKAAVITFSEPYADWWDLFGGTSGFVLKKRAFPPGHTDLKDDLLRNIPFSGHHWKLQSFGDASIVLARNTRFWRKQAYLDTVTAVRSAGTAVADDLKTGFLSAAYPPAEAGTMRLLRAGRNLGIEVAAGPEYEGLWFNLSQDPVDDRDVREAIARATDRAAIVDAVLKPVDPGAQPLQCAGSVPTVAGGRWCDETDFADITYDPAGARRLLEGAGWRPGADGIYAKGGRRLTVEYTTTAGNAAREQTEAILTQRWKAAGIELVTKNAAAPAPLFTDVLPKLDYMAVEYAQAPGPDPGLTAVYACDEIPSAANGFTGQNYVAWCDREASDLAAAADREIDAGKRAAIIERVADIVRRDVVWLPLYQRPRVMVWRKDVIAGPVGASTASSLGGFADMHRWYLTR